MRRPVPILFLSLLCACDSGSSSAPADASVSELGGMVGDPLAARAYLSDGSRGLLSQFDLRRGSVLRSRSFGTRVGALAIDSSGERLALSLPDRGQVALFDVLTWRLLAVVPSQEAVRALAFLDRDRVAVVRGSTLQSLDLRDGALGPWQLPVLDRPQLRFDERRRRLFVMDEQDRGAGQPPELRVRCLRLDDPSLPPPECLSSERLLGRGAAMQLDWDGEHLLVATQDEGGTYVLDSNLQVHRQDTGRSPGTLAASFNATGTRLYRAMEDSSIMGVDLDRFSPRQEAFPVATVQEGGLLMASDGLHLLSHLSTGELEVQTLFELQLQAPPIASLDRAWELELLGPPGARVRVFAAERPGYQHLDRPTAPRARFLDLDPGSTLTLAQGRIGEDGTARARFAVPFERELVGERFVLQAASLDPASGTFTISNPFVVQLREPRLPR